MSYEQVALWYYRADSVQGPFTKLNRPMHKVSVCGDFLGVNDRMYCYRVRSVAIGGGESDPSKVVSATSHAMTDEQLLRREELIVSHPLMARLVPEPLDVARNEPHSRSTRLDRRDHSMNSISA